MKVGLVEVLQLHS